MKPNKLTAIISAGVITVLSTALVFSLMSYSSRQSPQKPSTPGGFSTQNLSTYGGLKTQN